tara:strand:- start:209 stop:448 length:240 start_codon:yes stop_codon:yes gene_type:complete
MFGTHRQCINCNIIQIKNSFNGWEYNMEKLDSSICDWLLEHEINTIRCDLIMKLTEANKSENGLLMFGLEFEHLKKRCD